MVRIRVLGRLAVEVDRREVALPASRRARALLAWLALRPGAHPRSDVAARFWPDVLDASARTSLRGALAELRRALGPAAADVLHATRESVELRRGDAVWIDLAEFDAHAAAGRLEEALALAAGPLLRDVEDDWAHRAREDHRRALLEVLGALADEAGRAGRHADAVALARRQVRLDPLSEELGRELVRRLAAAGDRAAALTAHAELVDRLRRDLGVAPAAETRRLAEEVRAGLHEPVAPSPAPARVAPAVPAAGGAVPPPPALALRRGPLVGREAELAQLDDVRARTAREGLQVALVAGEPGIGKTRLALAAAQRALDAGAAVLYGRSDEDGIVPYEPWLQAVGRVLAHASEERLAQVAEDGGAELARLFPELRRRRPDLAAPVRAEPETERWRLFEAMAGLLGALAAERPLVVVLDDAHWADRSTLLLLRHVVRARRHEPVCVVLCLREAELAPDAPVRATVAELRREELLTKVALRGLGEEEVGALVARRGRRADPGFVRALHQETEGNPFFVEEVLRNLPDVAAGRGARLSVLPVPEGVRDAVGRRLARLGERTRRALVLGAVIGRDFDLELLEHVAGEEGDGLVEALDEAVEASVVEEVGVGRYSFLHALIRATLHDGLSRTRRARLHLRVARALEELRGADARPPHGELAHHFLAAGDPAVLDRAIEHLRAAHGQALEQLAHEEAAGHAERAVAALEEQGAGPDRTLALRLDLGEAWSGAGERTAARAAFAAAAGDARATGDAAALGRAALGLAGPSWQSFGQVDDEAIGLLEEALARLGPGQGRERVVVGARLAVALYFARVPGRVRALTDAALAGARAHDDPEALAAALQARLHAAWQPGGAPERLAAGGELLALAERSGLPELAVEARRWRVVALLELARTAEARAEIAEHARLARELRRPYELLYVAVFAAMLALHEGRLEDAERESARVAAFGESRGGADALQFVGVHVLTLCELRGVVGTIADAVRAFADGYPALPAWRAGLAYPLACAGRADEAREVLAAVWPPEEALPRDATWLPGVAFLALACGELGEAERAAHLRALLAPHAGEAVVLGAGGAVWGSVDHVLGVLAVAAGDPEGAEAHLRAALALEREMGATAWARRTERVLAGLAEPARAAPGRG